MWSFCKVLVVLIAAIAFYFHENLVISYKAFQKLRHMPQEDIDQFFDAYNVLEKLGADYRHGVKNQEEITAMRNYYKVLHQVLAVGVVMEIMLMPPALDPAVGVLKNIDLWIERMIDFLNLQPGQSVLDVGSGRGKVAQKVQKSKGVRVIQVNFDQTQLDHSRDLAREAGNEAFMEWHNQDYNDPFPFIKDGSLDAQFCAQACAFMTNKTRFLKEVYRMLKPGGMVYNLEWLVKDKSENQSTIANYDPTNATHWELVRQTGALVGGSFPSGIHEWELAFKESGLELIASREPSETHTMDVMKKTSSTYEALSGVLIWLSDRGIISSRFKDLYLRLKKYSDAAFEAMEQDLCSLTYEFVARKPLQ